MKALMKERDALIGKMERLIEIAETGNRSLTAYEQADWERYSAECKRVNAEIDKIIVDRLDAEKYAEDLAAEPPAVGARGILTDEEVAAYDRGKGAFTAEPRQAAPCADRSYKGMFGQPQRGLHGFRSRAEFFDVLHGGRHDNRLVRAMSGLTGSAGGFVIPDEMVGWLMDASLENEIMRPAAQVYAMSTDTRKIPAWDGMDHSSNLYGGITAAWTQDLGSITASQAATRLITMRAQKLAALVNVSNELEADGLSVDEQLSGALVKAIGWYLDYGFLRGTGAGEPLGVLNNPSLVTVSKESGQSGTILYPNLTKMFARMHPACLNNAVWLCNSSAIPQLLQLSVEVGDGGSHVPVLTETNGQFRILTKPVFFTEKLPALGTKGDILFVDRSQYAIGLRKDVTIEKSGHAGFSNDSTYYRAILRGTGQGTWGAAVTPKAGDSLSWAVALETR